MINLNIEIESVSRPRWMIVDDNKEVLTLMSDIVARCIDADIQCFHSPHIALAAFTSAPEAFDFVITDLEMPSMSGIELGSQLRQLSPAIKVLLATGSGILTTSEASQKGFCGMLQKPFFLESLHRALEAAGVLQAPTENNEKTFVALTMA